MKLWRWFRERSQRRKLKKRRILVLDTSVFIEDAEEIWKHGVLAKKLLIPMSVLEEIQRFYWIRLYRKYKKDDIEDDDRRDQIIARRIENEEVRNEKARMAWKVVYENIRSGKWQLVGSRGKGKINDLLKELCLLSNEELLVWINAVRWAARGRRNSYVRLKQIDTYWDHMHRRRLQGTISEEKWQKINKALLHGWRIIRKKIWDKEFGMITQQMMGPKSKGKWWLSREYTWSSPGALKRQFLEMFNQLGQADMRILASILVLKEYDPKDVYLVTRDRHLEEVAYYKYGINVIKTVR